MNTVAGKTLYNAVLLCQSAHFKEQYEQWESSFSGAWELMFYSQKMLPQKGVLNIAKVYIQMGLLNLLIILFIGSTSLTDCVTIGVIAHMSLDNTTSDGHFNSGVGTLNIVDVATRQDLLTHLIQHFSPDS